MKLLLAAIIVAGVSCTKHDITPNNYQSETDPQKSKAKEILTKLGFVVMPSDQYGIIAPSRLKTARMGLQDPAMLQELQKQQFIQATTNIAVDMADDLPGSGSNSAPGGGGGSGNVRDHNVYMNISNTPFGGFGIMFTYGYNADGSIDAGDFSGKYTGYAGAVSYDGKTSTYHVTNGTIYFTMNGYDQYSLFADGIGTYWTQAVEIKGSYNPRSGSSTASKYPMKAPVSE